MAVRLWSPDTDLAKDTSVPLTTLIQQGAAANQAELRTRQLQEADSRTTLIEQTIGRHTKIGPGGQAVVDREGVLSDLQQRDPVAASQAHQHFVDLDTASQKAGDEHIGAQDKHSVALNGQRDAQHKAILSALGSLNADSPTFPQERDAAVRELAQQGIELSDEDKNITPDQARHYQRELIGPQHIYDATERARLAGDKRYTIFKVSVRNGDGSTSEVPHVFDGRTGAIDTVDAATAQAQGAQEAPAGWTPPQGGNGANPAPDAQPAPASPTVRRVMGWTPRRSQGGDNSDAAVDSKIATLAHQSGVSSPDVPMTPQQFQRFAAALPATEGGSSSLTGRLNNPGGIKDGRFAKSQPGYAGAVNGYAKFDSPDSGHAAMTTLLANFYNRGQKSIRDIIEGRPVSGPTPRAIAAQRAASPNGGQHIDTSSLALAGKPKPEEVSPMSDKDKDYTAMELALGARMSDVSPLGNGQGKLKADLLARRNKILEQAGITPGEAIVLAAQNKAGLQELITVGKVRGLVESFERTAQANLEQVISALPGGISQHSPILNRVAQYWRGQIKGDPGVVRLAVALKTYTNEYSKVMTAVNNQSPSDSARSDASSMMNQAMTGDQIYAAYTQMKTDMANRHSGIEGQRRQILNQLRTGEGIAPNGRIEPPGTRLVTGPDGKPWRQYKSGKLERVQ